MSDVLFLAGLALTVAGIAAIYWPAALIAAGLLTAALAFAYERGQ